MSGLSILGLLENVAGLAIPILVSSAAVLATSIAQRRSRHAAQESRVFYAPNLSSEIVDRPDHYFDMPEPEPPAAAADVHAALKEQVRTGIAQELAARADLQREEAKALFEEKSAELDARLQRIEQRFPATAEVDKYASVNDALFAQLGAQLTARIDKLEQQALNRWDVAKVASVVAGGIATVVGATYAVLKAFGLVA
jgi:hypothetical protein